MSWDGTLRLSCLGFLSLLPLGGLHAQIAATLATFRTSARMVLVPVTVTDRNGKTIEGLRPQNFTLLDDQRPQPIASLASEDTQCSVGLVLDISGSMQKLLGAAKEVTHAFLTSANPEDEFLLTTVSTQPDVLSGFTPDIADLERSIESTRSDGFTALIDTVYLTLSRMRHATRPRRALLILSDGMDNRSRYSKAELMRVALEADVQIYTIIFDNPASDGGIPFRPAMIAKPWDRGPQNQGRELLEELSDKTGGLHFFVRDGDSARAAAARAARTIRDEYVIGYQSPDATDSGKWHRIRVKSDLPNVKVYARSGYYSH